MSLESVKRIITRFKEKGFECFLAGGSVRDLLFSGTGGTRDWDLTTNATPEEIKEVMGDCKTILTGEKYGTVKVEFNYGWYEITTYRTDGEYYDYRHPIGVQFETRIEKDLARRDFTINAMACDPTYFMTVIDPFGGQQDHDNKLLRAVGNPFERFTEDPLRILRLFRFKARYPNFDIDYRTRQAATRCRELLREISAERIKDELWKILSNRYPSYGLQEMCNTLVMEVVLPEVARLKGIKQPEMYHKYDVLEHTLRTVDETWNGYPDPTLRFAALLHDIGKEKMNPDGPPFFPDHASQSVVKFEDISKRLKLSNYEHDYIKNMIYYHMSCKNYKMMSDAGIRRFMKKFIWADERGINEGLYLDDLCALQKADIIGSGRFDITDSWVAEIDIFEKKAYDMWTNHIPLKTVDLKVDGYDLMALEITGPFLGMVINKLMEEVLEDPTRNSHDNLIKRGVEIYKDYRAQQTELMREIMVEIKAEEEKKEKE